MFICDRCRKKSKGIYNLIGYAYDQGFNVEYGYFPNMKDVCHDCFKDFISWMNAPGKLRIGPV